MDVSFDNFMVKFNLADDKDKVLGSGPWMFNDHYLAVKQWLPSFKPCEESLGRTMVQIHITGLNIFYCEEKAIKKIALAVGRPIEVDLMT